MTDQTYPPQHSDSTRSRAAPAQEIAQDEWKTQLDRLLEEYRNHYVLLPRPEENPRP
jgi:hypothetical protein